MSKTFKTIAFKKANYSFGASRGKLQTTKDIFLLQ